MDNDETVILIGFLAMFGLILVLGLVATIANSISSLLVDIGIPVSVAGDVKALLFAGLLLGLILFTVQVIFGNKG